MRRNKGFTAVEVCIVLAIIGLLVAIAVPNLKKAHDKSKGISSVTVDNPKDDSETGKALRGEHKLTKMFGDNKELYFKQCDGQDKDGKTRTCLAFSWQTNEGGYAISLLSVLSFRTVFEDYLDQPFIKFRWKSSSDRDLTKVMDNVVYAEVHCKEADWPGIKTWK